MLLAELHWDHVCSPNTHCSWKAVWRDLDASSEDQASSHSLSPRGQPEGPARGCKSFAFSIIYSGLVNKTPEHSLLAASKPQMRGRNEFPPLSISRQGRRDSHGLASNSPWQLLGAWSYVAAASQPWRPTGDHRPDILQVLISHEERPQREKNKKEMGWAPIF